MRSVTTVEEQPKLREGPKKIKRSQSIGDTEMNALVGNKNTNKTIKRKKKHKSSNIVNLLSPRKRISGTSETITQICEKCKGECNTDNSVSKIYFPIFQNLIICFFFVVYL